MPRSSFRVYSLLFSMLCLAAPLAGVTVTGHTAGAFQVGESGAASYTVPITTLPGTSGVEPQLALTYNSQGNNSLLGIGWALSGLSVISRCPATVAQDGSLAPVDFDGNDRFCLDGERLLTIGGLDGANATEYRTEQDTFRQVISNGQAGIGPESFTVRTKAGLTYEYGGTADSRIEAQGKSSVLFWAVNRITDTKGNYLTVTYAENGAEYRPSRIDYTGNESTGLIPYASVRFVYELRPDATPQYIAGSQLKTTQRLTAVRAYDVEQLYREYRLAYQVSEATGRSRLASITECGSNGDCFAPTAFVWRAWAASDFNFNGTGSGSWPGQGGGPANNFLGDFNGDGKTDTAGYAGQGLWHVVFSNGDSFRGGGFWAGHQGGPTNNFLGDFNGDGKTDIMGYGGSQGLWQVALSNGTSFSAPGSGFWNGHNYGVSNNFLGDFNGDGKTDIMGFTGVLGVWQVGLSTGTNFNALGSGNWNGHQGRAGDNFIGDFNGDGRSDSLGYTGVSGKWHVALSSGTSFTAPGSGIWNGHTGSATNNFLGDFNGDGKTDIMAYAGSGLWQVALSSGTDFNAPGSGNWNGHTGGAGNNILGDFNGDGMTDIAGYQSNSVWKVCLSTGTNFTCRDWVGHSGGTSNNFLGDLNGDGKTDMMQGTGTVGGWQVVLSGGPSPDLLASIADGHGLATNITYAPLTDSNVYTKGTGAVYPGQDFQGPLYVVASYTTSNGIGGTAGFSHRYSGARINLAGRGFRGFEQTTVTDTLSGIKTTVFYERGFRYINSKVRRTEQRQPNGILISEVDNTLALQDHGFGVNFSFVSASIAKTYELDGSLISTIATTTDFDDHGNLLTSQIDYGDGVAETTAHTYQDDLDKWFLGRLTRSVVNKTASGRPTQTRTSAFTYDPDSGLLTSEIVEPDHPTLRLIKTYQHDALGNVAVSTTSGPGIVSRTHTTIANARGRIAQSINPLGHVETKNYSHAFLTKLTGPNLLATSWEYDGFGRQTRELRADGTQTLASYTKCQGNCPENAVYFVRSDTPGKPYTVTYYDLLDRVVRQETQGFDGTAIYVDTKYTPRGFRKWMSEPYFAGATPPWTEYKFDVLGRVTQEIAPGNRITTIQYNGRTSTVTNPLGQQSIRTVDARGKLIASTDPLSHTITYAYDASGNMITMTDSLGHNTTLTYDVRGNKTSITDPDTGTATFAYNTLGELIAQTDANHNTVTFSYDVLGRQTSRTEPDGISTWDYDAQSKGLGKLSRASRGDYSEEYFYDALGRPETTRIAIAGSSYTLTTGYDLLGRPDILIYPTGFGVRTLYNSQGYPQTLRRTSDNLVLWQAGTINARGQLEQANLGNGLVTTRDFNAETGLVERIRAGGAQSLSFTYDAIGNLQSRRDDVRGLSEVFGYDTLNRLTSSQVSGRAAVTLTYDELGNITTKSDVGLYSYGENGAGPHAVTSIAGLRAGTYRYDANGNLVLRSPTVAPSATTVAYTSFNKPQSISEGATTLAFSYGPQFDRYRQVVTTSGGVTTKLYIGGLFERETTGTTVRNIHYIRAEGEVFAVYIAETTGATTLQSTRYLHRDHLGSVQTITSETGAVVEVLAFDPWGLRRNAQDWSPATTPIASMLDRGFTGHEHLDEVSLIHMNGRVYDPVIGRFLSADPFVQAPEYSQSLNRYSYVLNNPLSMTDPDGLFFHGLTKFLGKVFSSTVGRVAISIVAGYLTMGIGPAVGEFFHLSATIGSAAGFGLGSSFAGALLSGGGLGDALRAGFLGALTSGLGAGTGSLFSGAQFDLLSYAEDVAAHGVTQGLSRVAKGDKFEHGFLSGVVDRIFSPGGKSLFDQDPVLHTLTSAVIGGTASELGGGKFANGAATTAFITGATHIALGMRSQMIAQSRLELDPDRSNSTGKSAGFWGDGFKLGGGRFDALHKFAESLLGGRQSGVGKFLTIPYAPGSTLDRLVEAYAGPHDFLNSGYWYDATGNIDVSVYSSVASEGFGTLLNVVNVVIATPLVVPSMVPSYAIQDVAFQMQSH